MAYLARKAESISCSYRWFLLFSHWSSQLRLFFSSHFLRPSLLLLPHTRSKDWGCPSGGKRHLHHILVTRESVVFYLQVQGPSAASTITPASSSRKRSLSIGGSRCLVSVMSVCVCNAKGLSQADPDASSFPFLCSLRFVMSGKSYLNLHCEATIHHLRRRLFHSQDWHVLYLLANWVVLLVLAM